MAPPKKIVAPGAPELSQRDIQVAALAWTCLKSDPQVDYEQLAQKAGYGTAKTAGTIWAVVKKKLQAYADAAATPDNKTGDKRKNAADEDGDEDGARGKPKARKQKKKKTFEPSSMVDEA